MGLSADSLKSPSRPQAELIQQTEEKADWEASFLDVGSGWLGKVLFDGRSAENDEEEGVNSNPIELSPEGQMSQTAL